MQHERFAFLEPDKAEIVITDGNYLPHVYTRKNTNIELAM